MVFLSRGSGMRPLGAATRRPRVSSRRRWLSHLFWSIRKKMLDVDRLVATPLQQKACLRSWFSTPSKSAIASNVFPCDL